ncbi:MAG: exopolysaccharide biosynthesis polyprenyl glycosylphosphotransferase [Thermoplasmata archaeon]
MRIALMAFILISLYLNLGISYSLAIPFIEDKFNHPVTKYLWFPLVYLLSFSAIILKSNYIDKNYLIIDMLKGNIISFLLTTVVLFFTKDLEKYSRLIQLSFFMSNFFLTIYIEILLYILKKYRLFKAKLLIVGERNYFEYIEDWAKKNLLIGFEILDKLTLKDLNSLKTNYASNVDYVLVGMKGAEFIKHIETLDYLQNIFKRIIYIPFDVPYFLGSAIIAYPFSYKSFAVFIENRLLEENNIMFKRIFDLLLAITLLIILIIPLIILYVCILIIDRQNPIFKHERIGLNGKPFYMLKFRTMRKDADILLKKLLDEDPSTKKEWEENYKLKNDPRITKLGKFLRKTSLDELPQLINIIKGDMSFVGPRPIVREEIQKYGKYFDLYKSVKPGLTGLWQVSGRSSLNYEERVRLDAWYVKNWSIELDLLILIKTVFAIFRTKDAY